MFNLHLYQDPKDQQGYVKQLRSQWTYKRTIIISTKHSIQRWGHKDIFYLIKKHFILEYQRLRHKLRI